MARPAKMSKAELATKLEAVFKKYGYEGTSLSQLATVTGLSKASLYHHFPAGKEAMAARVLAHSGARLQADVLTPLGHAGSSGGARLLASLDGTGRYYDGEIPICLMNSLLLGEGRHLFGSRIDAAVTAWREGLSRCLQDDGVAKGEAIGWATDALQRIQGALVMCRVSGARKPLEDCLAALKADVDDWLHH